MAEQPDVTDAMVPADTVYWTDRRQKIHIWLDEQAPSLAELYKGAVCLIFDQLIPGRIRFIGHAVREIRNRLPGEVSSRLDYTLEVNRLLRTWANHDLPLSNMMSDADAPISPQLPLSSPAVSIPSSLFVEIQLLLQKHSSIPRSNRERAKRLFERFVPEAQSTPETLKLLVNQWWQTTEWFMEKTHDNGQVDTICDEKELKSRFEEFESFLSTLSQNFYSNTDELDKILEDTNT